MSKRARPKKIERPGFSNDEVDEIKQFYLIQMENGGINFDDFVDAINDKLEDKESKEGIKRIFDLFIDDPNADTITLRSLKKISKELGENMSDKELKDMLERASKNGVELTFEEFYDIMTKKSFL